MTKDYVEPYDLSEGLAFQVGHRNLGIDYRLQDQQAEAAVGRRGKSMSTQHRDHYGDYIDLLKCHDALLEAAKSAVECIGYCIDHHDPNSLQGTTYERLEAAIAAHAAAEEGTA